VSTVVVISFVSFVSFVLSAPQALFAQMTGAPTAGYKREAGMTASTVPAPLREIGFDQNIDQLVPLDVTFRDEAGRSVALGEYFGKRPVVMVFAYYDCPMLCTLVINGLASALDVLSLEPGKDFEIVTVSYGLRNLSDWERGLREMVRVARTGGRLLVLEFGKPDNAVWRALYFGYLRACVPLFGKWFCGEGQTYAYILESLQHYPAQHGVLAKMREFGCREVRLVPLLGGVMTIHHGVKP